MFDYRTGLEAKANCLVGRHITRVRYDLMTCDVWDEFGPDVDAAIDSILLELDGNEPAYLTWSNESGFCYGITIAFRRHWTDVPDHERSDGWITLDVGASTRWREVCDQPIIEARLVWSTVLSEEIPRAALNPDHGEVSLDDLKAVPHSVSTVPQELALRFASGHWIVISAARFHGDGNGFWSWMDELLVVHDEDFMRRNNMGPYAASAPNCPP